MVLLTEAIKLTLFPAMMAFAASSDLFTMTIANRVSLILVGGFGLLAVLTGTGASDLLSHAAAAASVLVVVFIFFSRGWIGGGDAKLAAATVLWLGFAHLADYLFYASIFGGALTLLIIYFRTVPLPAVFSGCHGPSGCIAAIAAFPMASHSRRRRSLCTRRPNG